jgi:hypothetical protein
MTLASYISDNFPTIKSQLSWNDSTQIVTIVEKALELYGVTTEAEATNTAKLHVLASVAVWDRALTDISLDHNFSADGASYSRSQAVDAVRKNLDQALSAALVYMPGYTINVHAGDNNPDWKG